MHFLSSDVVHVLQIMTAEESHGLEHELQVREWSITS